MPLVNLNRRLERIDRHQVVVKRSKGKFWIKLLLILLISILAIYLPVRSMYSSYKQLRVNSQEINEGFKNNDLDRIKNGLTKTKDNIESVNGALNWLIYLRFIPFVGGYYADAKHFVIAANYELAAVEKIIKVIEPSKQELGFTGQPVPGQDRIAQMVKILDKILPQVEVIEPEMKKAAEEVASIDISKYPEKYGSTRVRSRVDEAKNMIIGAHFAVTSARPALEVAPNALGYPNSKNYLILFQNDKEIRATGGFLTAFAYLKMDQGHLSTSKSDDIYRLDEQLLSVCRNVICPLTPPAPIVKYLPEVDGKKRTAWSLRDSNISPDVPTFVQQFEKIYAFIGDKESFDGIILIDTQVVEEMIKITGPVDVFGTTYSAEIDKRCNCPNVIYELEHYAEVAAAGQADRKAVLGTLMQQILARALAAGNDKMPDFINTAVRLANDKHMIFYMHDAKTQSALADLNWTGQIKNVEGDYLHINDSNFAGGKSNLYVEQRVTDEISIDSDGNVKARVTIEYKNPQPFNIWLNGINRDYVRVYVPKGSELISSKGSDDPVATQEDQSLNKTYFEAFIQVRPQNSRVLSFEYKLPFKATDKNYKLLIQKQPGAKDHQYTVKINGRKVDEFKLTSDHPIQVGQ